MARRPSKHLRAPRPLLSGGSQRRESRGGRTWIVRDVPAHRAVKEYRCPGCDQRVAPGTPHLVAWPDTPPLGAESGLEVRRHWHPHCWRLPR
ncbi:hypothetical protein BCR15_02700 [Tessaracoccus lapidicaptus]|uniref:Uncharacterized protein n=1 Tax=Tessaracoccus lapidicaptus TaxID=1427523 RepID=A0A1C0ANA4_9ACTN|nr:hypothetical protein BKM78_01310 [Tessaracoccus sp. T2.5-30]OCL34620.1 hypothetical protein BCR15_02700 [Tessaracoccus lapidicaptus]VEP38798.1 hypothetical protein TLA_TLA_00266 [Tessaracoccus lapidicaptus]